MTALVYQLASDTPATRNLTACLQAAGYQPRRCSTAAELEGRLREAMPMAVIAEAKLLSDAALISLAAVKQEYGAHWPPFVVLSVYDHFGQRLTALRLGADRCLPDTAAADAVLAVVNSLAHASPKPLPPTPEAPLRLLLVGTQRAADGDWSRALQQLGLVVRHIDNHAEALSALAEFRPAVLLVLSEPAECSLEEFVRVVRDDGDCLHIPILYAVADDTPQPQLAGLERIVDAVLPPAISGPRIAEIVSACHRRSRHAARVYQEQRAAIAESAQLRALLDRHAGLVVTDLAGTITYVNAKCCGNNGYTQGEMLGRNHRVVKSGKHPDSFFRELWETISCGSTWQGRICNRRKNGTFYWVQATIMPLTDNQGRPSGYMSLRTDITDIVEAEIRLMQFQQAMEIAKDGKAILDAQGRHLYANPAYVRMYGYQTDTEILGQHWRKLCPSSGQFLHRYEEILSLLKESGRWAGEIPGKRKDGKLFPQDVSVTVMTDGCSICEVRDLSSQKEAERLLRESEELFRTSANAAVDGLVIIDHEDRVSFWNNAAEKMFGYSAEEMKGRKLHPAVLPARFAARHQSGFAKFSISGEGPIVGKAMELSGLRRNGVEFPVEVSVSALRVRDKWHAVGLVRDITQRKQQEKILQEATERAEQASRAKSEFLSSMSHELRTPLNGILGLSQLLSLENQLTRQQRDNVAKIEQSGRHLLVLITDILDLSKIEAEQVTVSLEPVFFDDLAAECFSIVSPLAQTYGVSLHSQAGCTVTPCADYTRLKQVLTNLLSNAIKYNHKGGDVWLSCEPTEQGRLRIKVKDSGKGIPTELQEHLFQPFNRLGAETGTIEGTGIGLVITRKLAELMGGAIGVESAVGQGSTFWIELGQWEGPAPTPSDNLEISPPRRDRRIADDTGLCQARLLVAEDNPLNRDVIEQQLRVLGYEVDMVGNGKDAYALWRTGNYPLILTDCHMPAMNGYELAKEIRRMQAPTERRTVIIAFTADAMKNERERCFEAGMDDVLHKPVDIYDLQQTLCRWLERANADASSRQALAEEAAHPATEQTPAVDPSVLRKFVGDDPAILRRLLDQFLATARLGVSAILEAGAARHGDDLKAAAHKLKSSARTVGAYALADLCETLESQAKAEVVGWETVAALLSGLPDRLTDIENCLEEVRQGIAGEIAAPTAKADAPQRFGRMRILLVDDDPFMREQLSGLLGRLGVGDVAAVDCANQALALVDEAGRGFDAILCDLCMPQMDGVTFLRHLATRRYPGGIIPISGTDPQILHAVAELAKVHDLKLLGTLQKPIEPKALAEMLSAIDCRVPSNAARKPPLAPVTEEELRAAINDGALTVHYQPKVELATYKLVAVEALVRWHHPQQGLLAPDRFIRLAEQWGLIDDLTDRVFAAAMRQGVAWRKRGRRLQVAVNLSTFSLGDLALPERLLRQAESVGMNVADIMLEVTEGAIIENLAAGLEVLSRLRLLGMGLSIDDFGTGYATLEQLQRAPFAELKVDRRFVSGASTDAASRAILESSIALGKKLAMTVVAEGVETQAEWDLVKSLGCDLAQGFFVAKPMAADAIDGWLADWTESRNRQG